MRPFGDCVRTGWVRIGVNLLVSLAASRVLEGKLGYDQLVILVAARQGLAREYHQEGLQGTGRARTRCNSGTLRTSL